MWCYADRINRIDSSNNFRLAINTVFMALGVPQWLRKSILLTSMLILIYNILEFSVGGMINEVLAISSVVVGIVRFRKEKN